MIQIATISGDGNFFANEFQKLLNDGWEIMHLNSFNSKCGGENGVFKNVTVYSAVVKKS